MDIETLDCLECGITAELHSYFLHLNELHGLFPCIYCQENFKVSKELLLHLEQEHELETQKFSNAADFLDKGGTETVLLCVECDKTFESDTLLSTLKVHAAECRNKTGVCPKCETIHSLKLLGEHIRRCQVDRLKTNSSEKTSHLRNRDNSCKHCGEKFSISTLAAHVRACVSGSTKSTYNSWSSNSASKCSTPVPEPGDDGLPELSPAEVPRLPEIIRKDNQLCKEERSLPRNGLPALPKLYPAPRLRVKNPKYDDYAFVPNLSPRKDTRYNQVTEASLPEKKNGLSHSIPVKEPKVVLNGSKGEVETKRKAAKRKKEPEFQPSQETLHDSIAAVSPYAADFDDVFVKSPSPPVVEIDPLLREQDDDRRLSLLIQELADKIENCFGSIGSVVSPSKSDDVKLEPSPRDIAKPYEVVLDDSPSNKSDSWILNEMICKSSVDCSYCKLVRLIRVDKRQLVLHLLTNHKWNLSVSSPVPPRADLKITDPVTSTTESIVNLESKTRREKDPADICDSDSSMVKLISDHSLKEEAKPQTNESLPAVRMSEDKYNVDTTDPVSDSTLKSLNTTCANNRLESEEKLPCSDYLQNCSNGKSVTESERNCVLHVDGAENQSCSNLHLNQLNVITTCSSTAQSKLDGSLNPPPVNEVSEADILECKTDDQSSCHNPHDSSDMKMTTTQANVGVNSVMLTQEETKLRLQLASDVGINGPLIDGESAHVTPVETNSATLLEQTTPTVSEFPVAVGFKTPEVSENALPSRSTEVSDVDISQKRPELSSDLVPAPRTVESKLCVTHLDCQYFRLQLLEKVFRSESVVFAFEHNAGSTYEEVPCHCLICEQTIQTQLALFPHWKKVHRGIAMRCTICKGKFLFAAALFSHMCIGAPQPLALFPTQMDDDEGVGDQTVGLRYHCGACDNVRLPGFFNLMVHMRKDHNRCELCLESLESQKDLEHHIKKHKLNHFCWKCNVAYNAKPNFMTHLFWKHGTESVECSKCLKKKWPHIYHFCNPPEYFTCEECGYHFTRPMALRVHRRFHTGQKLKRCPKFSCGERFVSKKLLKKHMEAVHPKPQANVVASQEVAEPTCSEGDVLPPAQGVSNADAESVTRTSPETQRMDLDNTAADDSSNTLRDKESEVAGEAVSSDGVDSLTKQPLLANDMETDSTLPPLLPSESASVDLVKESSDNASESTDVLNSGTNLEAMPDVPEKREKPFDINEIQGPNLSEDESESDSDENTDEHVPHTRPTAVNGHLEPASQPDFRIETEQQSSPIDNVAAPNTESAFATGTTAQPNSCGLNLSDEDDNDDEVDISDISNAVDQIKMLNAGANLLNGAALDEVPDLSNEDMGLLDGCDKTKSSEGFGSISPLLPSLEDFNFQVPEIPTFEENLLPDHIIQENALFSIQNEHDYSVLSTNIFGIKRKPLSPGYSSGSVFQEDGDEQLNFHTSSKKSKSPMKSTRKRKFSSSSSSSSSSSCSSCGSDCSCSSDSSGSSSGSGSSDSDSEQSRSPFKKSSKSRSPMYSSSASKHSPRQNGKLPRVKSPKKKRKTKSERDGNEKEKEELQQIEPEPEKEPEPIIWESDLETDDSGSEEAFHKMQLSEEIAASAACDAVWDMKNEKYLLKLLRGVDEFKELLPPPAPAPIPIKSSKKKEKVSYSLKNAIESQPKLKVRNVPIKPLIVKRNSLPTKCGGKSSYGVATPEYRSIDDGYTPLSQKGKERKSFQKTKPVVRTLSDGSAFAKISPFSPQESIDGFSSGAESGTKRRKSRKKLNSSIELPQSMLSSVNEDEQLYCVCQSPHDNVSQMIGCDGKDCQYKWFHFECVGICIPPKGKWYCGDCRVKRRRKAAKLKEVY